MKEYNAFLFKVVHVQNSFRWFKYLSTNFTFRCYRLEYFKCLNLLTSAFRWPFHHLSNLKKRTQKHVICLKISLICMTTC